MAIDNVVVSTGAVTLFDRIDQNNKTSTLTIQTSSGVTDVLTSDTPPAQSGPGAFSSLVSILAPRMAIDGLSGQQISDALNRLEQALQSLNPSGPDGPGVPHQEPHRSEHRPDRRRIG